MAIAAEHINLKTMCAMKKNLISTVAVVAIVATATLSSCVSSLYSSANRYDDLYAIHDVEVIAARQKAEAEVRQAEAEARRAEALALQAEMEAELAKQNVSLAQNNKQVASAQSDGVIVVEESGNSFVANSYESAYARRLRGFQSANYRMPSSYYSLRYDGRVTYATAYDPAFYNIMVSGDEVWVEPKYITSMFGTWGATRASITLSPWYYGWGAWASVYDPWYYSCWGFPHYSWWDWNWNICYGSHWGSSLWWGWGGLYRPWHHHHHFGWYGHHHHHYHSGPFWYGDMWGGGGGWYHGNRGGSYYGSRDNGSRLNGGGRQPARGSAVVNRGSSTATPYRSPSSGNVYGNSSRAGRYASALEQQRNGSVGRGTTPNTSRASATTSQSSGRSNSNQRSSAYDSSRSSSSSRNTSSASSYNSSSFSGGTRSSSSSFSGGGSSFSGGGSRSGGSSSGSRGR